MLPLVMQRELDMEKYRADDSYVQHINEIREANPDFWIVDYLSSGEAEIGLVCRNCGSIEKYSNFKPSPIAEHCQSCLDDIDHMGTFRQNYENKSFNQLNIKNQYINDKGWCCTVVCLWCGNKHAEIPLFDVVNQLASCPCDKKGRLESHRFCPNCKNPLIDSATGKIGIPISKISEGWTCDNPSCNKFFTPEELKGIAHFEETAWSFRRRTEELKKLFKFNGYKIFPSQLLITEEKPLYERDGIYYYRCVCVEHRIIHLLSEAEIKCFTCKECLEHRKGGYYYVDESNDNQDS
jgi:Txe/YoeB family toxin of Txe-Axe toxin-antitoxin module